MAALKYHQLVPLVQEWAPTPQLRNWQLANLRRVQNQQTTRQYLTQFFTRNEIEFRWLKGHSLTAKLYATSTSRYAGDLDVLLKSRAAVIHAALALLAEGWRFNASKNTTLEKSLQQHLKLHKDFPLSHPQHGTLELHYRVTATDTPLSTAYETWLWQENSQEFSSEEFLYLCYHGATTAYHRLKWLYDIHLYITRWVTSSNLNALIRKAEKLDCTRPLLLSSLLAHQIFNTPVPTQILQRVNDSKALQFAAKRVVKNANKCSGRNPSTLYRLERRLFWYFAHECAKHRKDISRHLFTLAIQRFK